ncbi:hypothetical protein [Thiobacillus sp.]|uniref:hypothetical protein n=1 Tax=Thiobacillus sp. TaxID=924 RepID=UPI00286E456F|nr:hypothetical protein [Thiobacillus sp.]
MKDKNGYSRLMLKALVGALLLAHAATATSAERLSLTSLKAEIDSLNTTLTAAQATITQQGAALATAQSTINQQAAAITALQASVNTGVADAKTYCDNKVAPVADKLVHFSRIGTDVYITGANLHLRNGKGASFAAGVNGLGNLIIGYNELRSGAGVVNTRTGSHNLIMGLQNNYSSAGAIIAGSNNISTNYMASVYGGTGNTAGGYYSAVVGGYNNSATGNWSTILGGRDVSAPNQLDHKP